VQAADGGPILLAIADSDRKHPGGEIGNTARKLEQEARKRPSFQRALVLQSRAAENLIPSVLYEEALAPHSETPSIPERLQKLESSVSLPWRRHADLKKGMKLFQIQAMDEGTPKSQFWAAVCKKANCNLCVQSKTCTEEKDCRWWAEIVLSV
jgi:hypothetical protein